MTKPIALFLFLICFLNTATAWEVTEHKHVKGARLLFLKKQELPIIDIRAIFDAGSIRDNELYGLAKLTNALLEEGTETKSATEVAKCFGDVGAQLNINAQREMAYAHLRILNKPEVLQQSISCFADILSQPSFTKDAISRVKSQIETAIDRELALPESRAFRKLLASFYPNHPYAHPQLGKKETIALIQSQDVKQFHKRFYTPKNLTLIVVGDTDFKTAQLILEELIRFLPQNEKAPPIADFPSFTAEKIEDAHGFPQATVLLAKPTLNRAHPDWPALLLANHAFGGSGLSSLLSESIREDHGLSYSAYSLLHASKAPTIFLVNVKTKSQSVPKTLELTHHLLSQLAQKGIDKKTFNRSKKHLLGHFARRTLSQEQVVDELGTVGFYSLPHDFYDMLLARIKQLTQSDVNAILKQEMQEPWTEIVVK